MAYLSRRQMVQSGAFAAVSWLLTSCSGLPWIPTKVARVGFLTPGDERGAAATLGLLFGGLHDLGYERGKNLLVESRFAGSLDGLYPQARELIDLNLDVILAASRQAAESIRQQTSTIPIVAVMPLISDPVEAGLVKTLARPGGNLTGQIGAVPEIWGKRLEFLKDAVSGASRVGILWDNSVPHYGGGFIDIATLIDQAHALGMQAQSFATAPPASLDGAFAAATSWRAEALLTTSTLNITFDNRLIPRFALQNRLPSISDDLTFAARGGLMSYAADTAELFRRATVQVGQILQGANPADIPMEQPTKFILSVNVTTAKVLGLTITDDLASQVTHWVS